MFHHFTRCIILCPCVTGSLQLVYGSAPITALTISKLYSYRGYFGLFKLSKTDGTGKGSDLIQYYVRIHLQILFIQRPLCLFVLLDVSVLRYCLNLIFSLHKILFNFSGTKWKNGEIDKLVIPIREF